MLQATNITVMYLSRNEKENRDERLQLFVWGEKDVLHSDTKNPAVAAAGTTLLFGVPNIISEQKQTQDLTGYRPRKAHTYDYAQTKGDELLGTNACVVFRSAEANLNYMEACYEKTGSLDAKHKSIGKHSAHAPVLTTIMPRLLQQPT